MDPNMNLILQRRAAGAIMRIIDGADGETGEIPVSEVRNIIDEAYKLAGFVMAMDDWLSGGGPPPKDWKK